LKFSIAGAALALLDDTVPNSHCGGSLEDKIMQLRLISITLASALSAMLLGTTPSEAKALKCKSQVFFAADKKNTKCPHKKNSDNAANRDAGGGGGGGSGGSGGGGGGAVSDVRLKHNLVLVGTTVFGLPLYDFEYNFKPGVYEGVMAQDVLKIMPAAVNIGPDGFYRVNYEMLGIHMKQLN
jgi:hypothetical protein